MASSQFWDDNNAAQKVIEDCNKLKAWTEPFLDLEKRHSDVSEMFPDAYEMGDDELISELSDELKKIETSLEELEIKRMLSGELDSKHCFLSINAGAGGTESCDWAQMLLRMYQKWATARGWKTEDIDIQQGEVAASKCNH